MIITEFCYYNNVAISNNFNLILILILYNNFNTTLNMHYYRYVT